MECHSSGAESVSQSYAACLVSGVEDGQDYQRCITVCSVTPTPPKPLTEPASLMNLLVSPAPVLLPQFNSIFIQLNFIFIAPNKNNSHLKMLNIVR